MPSRVSGNHVGVITTGGHKTLPYDVVVVESEIVGRYPATSAVSRQGTFTYPDLNATTFSSSG